jgi:hypothetical protein
MRFLKLFENFSPIKDDIKDILTYLTDDFELEVEIYESNKFFNINIFDLKTGKPKNYNTDYKHGFTLNEEIKKILDTLINYCKMNELKFEINLYNKVEREAWIHNTNRNKNEILFKDAKSSGKYKPWSPSTKQINSLSELENRFVNYITIEILKTKELE